MLNITEWTTTNELIRTKTVELSKGDEIAVFLENRGYRCIMLLAGYSEYRSPLHGNFITFRAV